MALSEPRSLLVPQELLSKPVPAIAVLLATAPKPQLVPKPVLAIVPQPMVFMSVVQWLVAQLVG